MTTKDELAYPDQINDYNRERASTDDLEKEAKEAAADADDARHTENSIENDRPCETLENSIDNGKKISKRKSEDFHEITSKRKRENDSVGYANVVASHYNQLEEKGVEERSKSRIVYLRNFHNWIKSMLINEYLTEIRSSSKKHNPPLRVLDIGCGKGGDLLKWKKGNITHLICSDIAEISLEQCKTRYNDMKERSMRDRHGGNLYSIEYISGDCSKIRLREKYSDPSMKLDMVSCQFAFHYSFESLPQAECMLRNASECLRPGGFFIGTIPNAIELTARAQKANSNIFGNDVYKVVFDCDINKPPLFGAKYNFFLDGVVNCPEFLVYLSVLKKLAKKYGLKFVKSETFIEFFNRHKEEGVKLLSNMHGLEAYPPLNDASSVGTAKNDYEHAEGFLRKNRDVHRIGTLSKSEWEASSLYLAFAFVKVEHKWSENGTPCYDI